MTIKGMFISNLSNSLVSRGCKKVKQFQKSNLTKNVSNSKQICKSNSTINF